MRSLILRSAIIASVALVGWASPVNAVELPSDPTLMHLKRDPNLFLTWTDEGARMTSEGDSWSFRPVETLLEVGDTLIVHDDTGACLSAGPLPDGAETAPLELVDCADATVWSAAFDDAAANQDWLFTTPDGLVLGLEANSDLTEDAEVIAVAEPGTSSIHAQEWLWASPPDEVPPEEPPASPTPSEEPPPAPKLPQTGAGAGLWAWSGAAAVSIAVGAFLTARLRRRALRTQW